MRKASLAAILFAAIAIPAVPGFAAQDSYDRVLPMRSGGSLLLENVTGSINIVGWDREAVEVQAVKKANSPADLPSVQIAAVANDNRVEIKTVYPADENVEVAVNYTVRVPRRVWLEQVATVNGAVHVSGVEGAGELRSVNGDVTVTDSRGGFSAHTTNGDIREEVAQLVSSQPLTLETINGSVALAVPPDTPAALEVRCWNGDFHSDFAMTMVGAYSPRSFQGSLGGGGTSVHLHTVNGPVRVQALSPGI